VLSSGSTIIDTTDYESIPEDEWIASDMTMYDSPLADLERQHLSVVLVPGHRHLINNLLSALPYEGTPD